MRFLVNLFLLLFFADAAASLLDQLISLASPLPLLSELRSLAAELALLTAFLVFQGLAIDKRAPKRILLPLMAYLCLVPIATWIFPSLLRTPGFGLLAAVGQLSLCLWPVHQLRSLNRSGFLMPKEMFEGPFFSLRNTVVFTLVSLVVLPVVSLSLLFSMANSFMYTNTSGFMRLAPGGIYMAEKTYQRDGRTVQLVGMIHMGEQQYYDGLSKVKTPGRTIVLAEGVTDNKRLLPHKLDYGKFAEYLGLTLQQDTMEFNGKLINAADLEKPRPRHGAQGAQPPGVDILRADVDVSSFSPTTLQFLDELGRQMRQSSTITEGFLASGSWSSKYATPEAQQLIMDDILTRRNDEVIGHLRKALDRYDTIVIPWGALHMPGIEEELLSHGFKLQDQRERLSMDFRKMLKARAQ